MKIYIKKFSEFNKIVEKNIKPEIFFNTTKNRHLKDTGSLVLKLNEQKSKLKRLLRDVTDNSFTLVINDDDGYNEIVIKFDDAITSLITDIGKTVDKILLTGYDTDVFDDKFGFVVTLNDKILNKVDIITGLPKFMKGLGIGKLFFKKLIKSFGYISFLEDETSDELILLTAGLATNDKNFYSFLRDYQLIIFDASLEPAYIVSVLEKFYHNWDSSFELDDDFMDKHSDVIKSSDILNVMLSNKGIE